MDRVLRRIENSMNDNRVIESHAENKYHIDLEFAKLGYRFPNTTPRTIDDIAKKNRGFLEAQKQIKFLLRLERDISGVVLYSKSFPIFLLMEETKYLLKIWQSMGLYCLPCDQLGQ